MGDRLPEHVRSALLGPGAPFEITTATLHGVERQVFARRPANLRVAFDATIARQPDAEMIVAADRSWTYREFVADVEAVSRRLVEIANSTRDGKWMTWERRTQCHSLNGKRLGIVGMGRIGTAVADRARAFGMTVVALRTFQEGTSVYTIMPGRYDLYYESLGGGAASESVHVAGQSTGLFLPWHLWWFLGSHDGPKVGISGQHPGFRQEPGVDPHSNTDTYAAVTFYVDNWRWAGVPFYIRSGKRMPKRVTDIAVRFNAPPLALFQDDAGPAPAVSPNLLIVRIQPEEGISLRFLSKQPGRGMRLRPVSMDFNYGSSFGTRSPTAYETLLVDAMIGDATLYTRKDMVEASWKAVQPVLDNWSTREFNFPNYDAGTWGPKESDEMLARNGHEWRVP